MQPDLAFVQKEIPVSAIVYCFCTFLSSHLREDRPSLLQKDLQCMLAGTRSNLLFQPQRIDPYRSAPFEHFIYPQDVQTNPKPFIGKKYCIFNITRTTYILWKIAQKDYCSVSSLARSRP